MGLAAVAVALTLHGPRLVVRSSTEFDSLLKTQQDRVFACPG